MTDEVIDAVLSSTTPLHQALVQDPDVISGDYNIHWLEKWLEQGGD